MMDTQLTERLETLLKTASFQALNKEDKNYVLSLITETEYQEYAALFEQLSTAIKSENDILKVPPSTLPKLQQAFQKKHTRKIKKIYYRPIAASLILGLAVYAIYQFKNPNESDYYLSDEEFNKHTQFNDEAYYINVNEFRVDDDVTEELMNMEFTP